MEQIIKAFIGIFFLLILTFGGIGITSAAIDASNAEEFVADAAQIVEASNFSPAVMENLKEVAKEYGYIDLNFQETDVDGDGETDLVSLDLTYRYSIKLLNAISSLHHAKSYAK